MRKWLPLIETTNSFNAACNWFVALQKKYDGGIIACAIMPNHLHAIIHSNTERLALNKIISKGKRFMAHELINWLETSGNNVLLDK